MGLFTTKVATAGDHQQHLRRVTTNRIRRGCERAVLRFPAGPGRRARTGAVLSRPLLMPVAVVPPGARLTASAACARGRMRLNSPPSA